MRALTLHLSPFAFHLFNYCPVFVLKENQNIKESKWSYYSGSTRVSMTIACRYFIPRYCKIREIHVGMQKVLIVQFAQFTSKTFNTQNYCLWGMCILHSLNAKLLIEVETKSLILLCTKVILIEILLQ